VVDAWDYDHPFSAVGFVHASGIGGEQRGSVLARRAGRREPATRRCRVRCQVGERADVGGQARVVPVDLDEEVPKSVYLPIGTEFERGGIRGGERDGSVLGQVSGSTRSVWR
jgi:hypothetical protein